MKQKNYSEFGWRRHERVAREAVTLLSMIASGKPDLTIITELPARSNTWKTMSVSAPVSSIADLVRASASAANRRFANAGEEMVPPG
ncbi:MAG: hypothetical protein V3S44_11635 [Alphaproteobacteria bacterium]